jgi:glycolate oxidase FAD binding subunit
MAKELLTARDAREVQELVAWANAEGKTIEVRGAGTKADIGRPIEADVTLSLTGLAGIIDYEPSELVLTARAGAAMAEIEAALEERGQRLAFEPMDHGPLMGGEADGATLGGIIAANASGPRRIKAGAARDHFLGFSGVSGRGEAFKAGGKVVKNVTGYDLSKLMAGSWGSLAVLTEVTVKTTPRPPEEATLLFAAGGDAAAAQAMSAALSAPAEVTGAAHLPASLAARAPLNAAPGGAVTAIRVEGVAPGMAPSASAIRAALPGLAFVSELDAAASAAMWRWIRSAGAFAGDARQVWRLSLAPMSGPTAVAAIGEVIEAEAFYDWGGGLVWLACADDPGAASVVRGAVKRLGGHATLVRASPFVRSAVGAFHPEPRALAALSRRIKAGFDPNGVLNPGRMWPED